MALTCAATDAILLHMDIRTEDLDAAVEAGVIDTATRNRLIAFARTRLQGASPDNESFRLLTGFNDIFVALEKRDADAVDKAMTQHLQEISASVKLISQENRDWFSED